MNNQTIAAVHEMRLCEEPFKQIKSGSKIYELRLYDEKRQKINPGDKIVFSLINEPSEKMTASVIELLKFRNFTELYNAVPKRDMGYADNEQADPSDMSVYYSASDISKYGVVAIKINLI